MSNYLSFVQKLKILEKENNLKLEFNPFNFSLQVHYTNGHYNILLPGKDEDVYNLSKLELMKKIYPIARRYPKYFDIFLNNYWEYDHSYIQDKFDEIASDVKKEFAQASEKFGPFNSAHEGYAVLLEEMDELKNEVWKKNRDKDRIREEAIQIAAMAIRFVYDITEEK